MALPPDGSVPTTPRVETCSEQTGHIRRTRQIVGSHWKSASVICALFGIGSLMLMGESRQELVTPVHGVSGVGRPESRSLSHLGKYEMQNTAVILVKPHALTPAALRLIYKRLRTARVSIVRRRKISGSEIADKSIFDSYYDDLLWRTDDPEDQDLPAHGLTLFEDTFGEDWYDDVRDDATKLMSISALASRDSVTVQTLSLEWATLKENVTRIKIFRGLEYGKMRGAYIVNGYLPALRAMFEDPDSYTLVLEVMWKPKKLSYMDYLTEVIGSTDPVRSHDMSIRHQMYHDWHELGLHSQPDYLHDCVLTSENLLQAVNDGGMWFDDYSREDHPITKELAERDMNIDYLTSIADNDALDYEDRDQPLYDHLYGLDRKEFLTKIQAIYEWYD